MKKFIQSILLRIANSVVADNPTSSTRVQSYIILFPILLSVMVFLIIEMWSFIHAIKCGTAYHLSNEIIIIFGMILAHHITIIYGRTKSNETNDTNSLIDSNQINNTDIEVKPVIEKK